VTKYPFLLHPLPLHFLLILILWKQCRLRAFEKSILQRAFGCKREEGEGMRKLGYEELVYFSAYIFRVIRSRKMKWLGHVACVNLKRRDYFGDLGVDLRIVVTWIGFEGNGLSSSSSGMGPVAACLKCADELSGCVKPLSVFTT
jgi:hypothetical protein